MSDIEATARWVRAEKAKGREWFSSLPHHLKNDLGDHFVLGTFDWGEWDFAKKPSGAFLRAADEARITWEIMQLEVPTAPKEVQ